MSRPEKPALPPVAVPRRPPPPPPRPVTTPRPEPPLGRPSLPTPTRQLLAAASSALRLRDEQLEARVQYYNHDLQTNAELDAITEQVVAELRAMGAVTAPKSGPRQEVEVELIHALRGHLEKLFRSPRAAFVDRKLEVLQRKISQLFFSSELYARLAEGESGTVPAATWPEQALYFSLKAHEVAIQQTLARMPVGEPSVRAAALAEFDAYLKRLCSDFLARTTPELERVLAIYRDVLGSYLRETFPAALGEFAWEVVRESRVAAGHGLGYKLTEDRFAAFREVFDRKFLERLVLAVQDPIARRAAAEAGTLREATLRFVSDPRIHAEICATIDDALYDYLHGEGFLDLPVDWRRALAP